LAYKHADPTRDALASLIPLLTARVVNIAVVVQLQEIDQGSMDFIQHLFGEAPQPAHTLAHKW
jgi:hypothetical protein